MPDPDIAQKEQFEKEIFDLTVARLKTASILGVILFSLFGIADYIIAPQYSNYSC